MNGKDIFIGLSYIDSRFVEEAELEALRPAGKPGIKRPLLIAAVIAMLLTLVGCGVAYAQGWFTSYFAQNSEEPLSPGQVEYIAENEQVIGESQVQNEWTVELRSAIHDSSAIYIIIGVTAPEGTDLEPKVVGDHFVESFSPGNSGEFGIHGAPDVLTTPPRVVWSRQSSRWEEDGDGLNHTKNYVIQMHLNLERSTVDPFGNDAQYKIHIENIVRNYRDEDYLQELMNGKYRGQTDVMFTPEETKRLHCAEVLVEGTWDFTVNFAENAGGAELILSPVFTKADIYYQNSDDIFDVHNSYETVKVTSFVLNPLSAVITYEHDAGASFTNHEEKCVYAVMKDGSQIELEEVVSEIGCNTLAAASPIVLEEVDHILMADGTKIPMP